MKIFVVHYSKLTERKKHILQQFNKHGLEDYEFIQNFDREDLTPSDISRFTNISPGAMSISLANFFIYKQISEKYEYALIFEDDVILADRFKEILGRYIEELPSDFDMLFIGDGCNLHIEQKNILPNINIYKKELYPTYWGGDGCTRCVDSYIVSNKCAKKLCEYIDNLKSPIPTTPDSLLNEISLNLSLNVYWAEPTIVTQGSQNNLFTTSH